MILLLIIINNKIIYIKIKLQNSRFFAYFSHFQLKLIKKNSIFLKVFSSNQFTY